MDHPVKTITLHLAGFAAVASAVLFATVIFVAPLDRNPPFFPDGMSLGGPGLRPESISMVWFGKAPVADDEWITRTIEKTFGFRVRKVGPLPLPPEARVPWSGQWDPAVLLDFLVDEMDLDAVRVLGVVQEDLAGGKAPWSLGLGQPEGKAAVISTFRLEKALADGLREGGDADALGALYRRRLYKLVCHELGHTFREWGNIHCPDRRCLMAAVEFGLADLDRVPASFCPRCRAEIARAVNGPVNTPVTYYHFGLYFEERKRLQRAEKAYRRALTLRPDFSQALNNLGALWMRMGRLAEAEEVLSRAVRVSPGYALAHLNLGRLLRRRGRHEEALSRFKECLRLDLTLTAAHRDGGFLLRDDLSDPERARRWFARYLEAGGLDDGVRRWMEERAGASREDR